MALQLGTGNVDVCRQCGDCPKNETWRGFAMPIGVDWLVNVKCAANEELGHSHAMLPVTHVRDAHTALGAGIWYYYARGCSDLHWNAGRTLLARNRVHAALLLEARLQGVPVTTASVVQNFASKHLAKLGPRKAMGLVGSCMQLLSHRLPTQGVDQFTRGSWFNATWKERLEAAISEVAFVGLYPGDACNVDKTSPVGQRCRDACLVRVKRLGLIVSDASVDALIWQMVKKLSSTPEALDSIQLHQQPQGAGSARWTTELWDVRSAASPVSLTNAMATIRARSNLSSIGQEAKAPAFLALSGPNDTRCMLSVGMRSCFACMGSQMEHRCHVRDRQAWCDTPFGRWRTRIRGNASCGWDSTQLPPKHRSRARYRAPSLVMV